MRRLRCVLAITALLSLVPAFAATPDSLHAEGLKGTAVTDFAQAVPANAVAVGMIQNTAADQATNLQSLATTLTAHLNLRSVLAQGLAAGGTTSAATQAMIGQVLTGFGTVFNGELGFALLPVTPKAQTQGRATAKLHILLEAGVQPGISALGLAAGLALLGQKSTLPAQTYRGLPIAVFDLRQLLAGKESAALQAGSPLSGTFYGTIAGNDAVLASDLPSLQAAIDAWSGAAPSLEGVSDFQKTVAALPAGRFYTAYAHFDTEQWRPLLPTTGTNAAAGASFPKSPGTASVSVSLSAEADGILGTTSPLLLTGSLVGRRSLPATALSEPALLPANTLAFLGFSDPGSLIRAGLAGAQIFSHLGRDARLTPDAFGPAQQDAAIAQINAQIGVNLDDQVFSWMHGDASVSLLPNGSSDQGSTSPAARMSLVLTLRVADQSAIEARLAAIESALRAIPNSGFQGLSFVDTPTSAGNVLHMLALAPTGSGYTFYHGYLIVASALPADFAAMQAIGGGGSLAADPLYAAALAHFGSHAYGSFMHANLTLIRQAMEAMAQAGGADLSSYRQQVQPVLASIKSLSAVRYAGPDAGSAVFLAIGG
jgi:hypothetical protein